MSDWWTQYEERAAEMDILAVILRAMEMPKAARSVTGAADDLRTLVDGLRQYEREARPTGEAA